MEQKLAEWRADQGTFRYGAILGGPFYQRMHGVTGQEQRAIGDAIQWCVQHLGRSTAETGSEAEYALVDDVLFYLNDRYGLKVQYGSMTRSGRARRFGLPSLTALLALGLLCGVTLEQRQEE